MPTTTPSQDATLAALAVVGQHAGRLRDDWRFDWPARLEHTAAALRYQLTARRSAPIVAIVGGASSGKSTLFNNLLDGRAVSLVAARGHATRGPILAVHEESEDAVLAQLQERRLLPAQSVERADLDAASAGTPNALVVATHQIESLRTALLLDTPDFTSNAAQQEGDLLWTLLPWFDRLVVVVDHERWFDRQSISQLRAQSTQFGQERMVVFNRTQEGPLEDPDRAALHQQAQRLAADPRVILEFRRGRGIPLFPPGTLDGVHQFVQRPPLDRTAALTRVLATAAVRVLDQNEERAARLVELRRALDAVVSRTLPTEWDCLTSLMTEPERRHLDVIARVLRIQETRTWVAAQTRRLEEALRHVPVVGALFHRRNGPPAAPGPQADRTTVALAYAEALARHQAHETDRAAQASAFWAELRRWTRLEPAPVPADLTEPRRQQARDLVAAFDRALQVWNTRVTAECSTLNANVAGAVGLGTVALALVLVAAPGPVAALTLVTAKSAIAGSLGTVLAATGAGAVFGRQMGRLWGIVNEKLAGSQEFNEVRNAAARFRALLEEHARGLAAHAFAEAQSLVIPPGDPMLGALETLARQEEPS